MARKVIYWIITVLLAGLMIFDGALYLKGGAQITEAFARLRYPDQLRILLGIAKLLGAITLLGPGLPTVKEWAYAGFTFAWIAASVAHYLAHETRVAFVPLVLLVLLFVSYAARPASRRCGPKPATA